MSGIRVHALRTQEKFFQGVVDGLKEFDIRKADRDFKIGDFLLLRELRNDKTTGATAACRVVAIWGEIPGLLPGYVCLSLGTITLEEEDRATFCGNGHVRARSEDVLVEPTKADAEHWEKTFGEKQVTSSDKDTRADVSGLLQLARFHFGACRDLRNGKGDADARRAHFDRSIDFMLRAIEALR